MNSICTVLSCTSEDYLGLFDNEKLSTADLVQDVLQSVIPPNEALLRAVTTKYRLDDVIRGMLMYAPHPLGQRYAAVALHIAHGKGAEAVVSVATAWFDKLLLPSLSSMYSSYSASTDRSISVDDCSESEDRTS